MTPKNSNEMTQPGDPPVVNKSGPDGFSNIEPGVDAAGNAGDAPLTPPPPAPGPATPPVVNNNAPKGRMAPTAASDHPQPGDRVFDERHEPVDDLDLDLAEMPHRWDDPAVLVAEINKHVRESHGLEPDKALLREIAAFIRTTFGAPEPIV